MIEILRPGPLTTVQDEGRPGLARFGVGPSGACDRVAYRLGNRLVGNVPAAASLELTLGGLRARFTSSCWVAVTGAPAPIKCDGHRMAMNSPLRVQAGAELRIGPARAGLRSYLAVRGGIAVPQVLGSRSRDTLAGIGPEPVRAGDVLPIGEATMGPVESVDIPDAVEPAVEPVVEFLVVRRSEWFTDAALDAIHCAPYSVAAESNRVGVRLCGTAIPRARYEELPSEGLVAGAIQVPPSGQPVIFLADHPVTGGYPVVGVVRASSLPLLAQVRPGQRLRLAMVG